MHIDCMRAAAAIACLIQLPLALGCRAPVSARPDPPTWCGPAPDGPTRIWGTAYDSLTRQPLARAEMRLQMASEAGRPVTARTDSLGRFCLHADAATWP